jgi:glycine C-acetyltransferase
MGTRIISGQTTHHEELEVQLATFLHKEDCFVVNYSYEAMTSVIDALCNRNDVIVYDSDANASIMDGIYLHRAKGGKSFVYSHGDADNCMKKLQLAQGYISREKEGGGILVVSDGVFDMSGEVCPLKEIVALKKDNEFTLLIDDSHGLGVLGESGRGTAEMHGVEEGVDLIFGSFAKTMAGIGGYIAGKEKVINYLRYNMRSQIFDESLPIAMVVGLQKRLELMTRQPERRQKLWEITNKLQNGLRELGFNLGKTESAITPIYLPPREDAADSSEADDDQRINPALSMVMDMRENYGIFCTIVKYPVVPQGTLMLRMMPTSSHTLEDVEYTLDTFKKLKEKLNSGAYDNQALLK